jgi:acetyl esterase/lipase
MPSGGGQPKALLLMIHGGGWAGQNANAFQSEATVAKIFQRYGYETFTFDYRKGAQGIADAQTFYEQARKRVGPKLPICAMGPSAGGNISLMLAVKNPDLACVIDFAGPTNLVSLAKEKGGSVAYKIAVDAFGKDKLAEFSPALQAKSIRAKVMLVFADTDPIVPASQGRDMARVLPGSQLIVLPPGPIRFVHSGGTPGSNDGVAAIPYKKSLVAELSFLANVARTWRPG